MEHSPLPSVTAESESADTVGGADVSSPAMDASSSGGGDSGLCEQKKLFVGGLPWDATEEALRDYFGKYGDVVGADVIRDRGTGSARGFAFVSFADPFSADRAIQDAAAEHVILGRRVEVRRAIPRGAQHQNKQFYNGYQHQNRGLSKGSGRTMDGSQSRTKKIFVGGLSANLTQEEFKNYFEKFGKITDVVVMSDNTTHRPRGFGFITFDTEESVEDAVKNPFHILNGKTVEVKKAVPREGSINNSNHNRNCENGNSCYPRMGNGRESNFDNYPRGVYASYSLRFGTFQGYGTHPYAPYTYGPGVYGGGYAFGGYGGYGAPYAGAWNTWSRPGFVESRQSPVPYGPVGFYPNYYNGGINPYVDFRLRGHHGSENGKWSEDENDLKVWDVNGTLQGCASADDGFSQGQADNEASQGQAVNGSSQGPAVNGSSQGPAVNGNLQGQAVIGILQVHANNGISEVQAVNHTTPSQVEDNERNSSD